MASSDFGSALKAIPRPCRCRLADLSGLEPECVFNAFSPSGARVFLRGSQLALAPASPSQERGEGNRPAASGVLNADPPQPAFVPHGNFPAASLRLCRRGAAPRRGPRPATPPLAMVRRTQRAAPPPPTRRSAGHTRLGDFYVEPRLPSASRGWCGRAGLAVPGAPEACALACDGHGARGGRRPGPGGVAGARRAPGRGARLGGALTAAWGASRVASGRTTGHRLRAALRSAARVRGPGRAPASRRGTRGRDWGVEGGEPEGTRRGSDICGRPGGPRAPASGDSPAAGQLRPSPGP